MLFHYCCSHAQVFGKTLVHEFLISYSLIFVKISMVYNNEWYEVPQNDDLWSIMILYQNTVVYCTVYWYTDEEYWFICILTNYEVLVGVCIKLTIKTIFFCPKTYNWHKTYNFVDISIYEWVCCYTLHFLL